jgi:hypothetical protein
MNYTREEAEEIWKTKFVSYHPVHFVEGYMAALSKCNVKELAEECKTLEADNERLREALEKIADPLKFILDNSKKEGMQVNVMAALHMSDSSGFLKEIAEKALNPTKD